MSNPKQDQGATYFEWPEPVVIDVIREHYRDVADDTARTLIARLHAAAIRELVTGTPRRAADLRRELIAACATCGIAAERIGRVDLIVLFELTQIVGTRFRNSPRLRAETYDKLVEALSQLRPERAAPRGAAIRPVAWPSAAATG